ncbi:YpjP family protein [Halobacillus sp. Marseille-Q1614]|uniref:YpjP family protein n=1 Tax=Halobacillus sp. Marseille-Q1614 TaxID=2709134 RepID=UPI00156DB8DD|nr:YpjP family protein [Halobacillus sp. Marseille-Q1614]
MNLWMRKVFVVLVTIMTLGLYIPPAYVEMEAADKKEVTEREDSVSLEDAEPAELEMETSAVPDDYLHTITEQAKVQMITKMGPRIADKVEDDVEKEILPKMEKVIKAIVTERGEKGEEEVPYYEITEELNRGYGEKIFTILDGRTKEEIARFDVRRDNRPGEGYWFNFHYHLSEDEFEEHHVLGEVYWDKNTPPKWMS